ncbi:MAG: hypothetical protein M1822_001264 [Bathelium mastoideum]|nr:MAG: hypothetical protein M1822_001264 [Bathelium mastoideum]
MEMAKYARAHLLDGNFFTTFFPSSLTQDSDFHTQIGNVYGRIGEMANETAAPEYLMTLTCDNESNMCQSAYMAHMNDRTKTMNFCDKFFAGNGFSGDKNAVISSDAFKAACKKNACHADTLYFAYRTKATTLLHEITHTSFSSNGGDSIVDVAYDVNDCKQLAAGDFDRSTRPYNKKGSKWSNGEYICPKDPKKPKDAQGTCDAKLARRNADTYVLVAAEIYFSDQCGKPLTLDSAPLGKRDLLGRRYQNGALFGRDANSSGSCNITLPDLSQEFEPDPPFFDGGQANSTTNSSSPSPTLNSSQITSPPCYNAVDENQKNYCECNNGASIPNAKRTGTNTGSNYQPCPWSTLPVQANTTSSAATPSSWDGHDYPYSFTDVSSNVVGCQSSSYAHYGGNGMQETMCAGASLTESFAPYATVQVGKDKINVGTLAVSDVYTSISSALESLCPSATGGFIPCSTETATIGGIDYIGGNDERAQGELEIWVQDSNYNDTGLRNAMIKSAATAWSQSINNTKNCHNETYVVLEGGRELLPEHLYMCNAASFAGVQYLSGNPPDKITDFIDAEWAFKAYDGGDFDCGAALEGINAFLDIIAPEFAIEDTLVADALVAGCEEVMSTG